MGIPTIGNANLLVPTRASSEELSSRKLSLATIPFRTNYGHYGAIVIISNSIEGLVPALRLFCNPGLRRRSTNNAGGTPGNQSLSRVDTG